MHPQVERLPRPDPDYRRFLAAVARRNDGPVPLLELAVHPEVVDALLEEPAPAVRDSADSAARAARLLHRLGYDVVKVSAEIPFALDWLAGQDASELSASARNWADEHAGPIASLDDFARYPWPTPRDINWRPVGAAAAVLPEGMKLIGFAGGVLEFSTYLLGLEGFMLAVYDQPELIEKVCRKVGQIIYDVFAEYCQRDEVAALWLGDDLGGKNGLLVSPDVLEEHVFPWYRRYVELAHAHGRPFLLHSCGRTEAAMPTLIEQVGIDAKHSFEDAIEPVEAFAARWGSRVGVLGGIDVNLLSVGAIEDITRRVHEVLERLAPGRGYVCGSGNSIPNYVAPHRYLAMVEAAHAFNGRC